MPQTKDLAHRNVTSTALPYRSNMSPTDTTPCYVPGSGDIVTSISGFAERRPGFSLNVENSPTTFNNLQRFFSWDRFDGTFIVMACDVNTSNQAVVYKLQEGTDNSFVSIFTDTGSANLFDFVVSNNTVYFSNGNTAKKYDPVNGVTNWGIAIGSVNNSAGPNTAGAGADGGGTHTPWTNPNNVTSAVSFATVSLAAAGTSNALKGTQFGFALSASTTSVSGIQISFFGGLTSIFTGTISVQMLKAGNPIGTAKFTIVNNGNITFTMGSSSDLWGTTWVANDINTSTFGFQIIASGNVLHTTAFQFNNFQITVFSLGGPPVSVSGSAGTFSATIGYQYVFCYGNSNSGHISSPSPTSTPTGPFGGIISTSALAAGGSGYANGDTGIVNLGNFNATYTINTTTGGAVATYTISAGGTGYIVETNVGTSRGGAQPGVGVGFTINITAITGKANTTITLTASTDPQVNQIRLFRSTDSVAVGTMAGTFFELPTSPYPNTSGNVTDSATDISLNIQSIAPFPGFNDPPTPGQSISYYSGRVWMYSKNKVFFSGLEEIINGVPEEAFPSGPAGNFWNFDQPVQGTAVAGATLSQTLGVFCGGRLYGITGNSLDTFRRFLVSNRRGCRNLNTLTALGGMVAWYDSSSTIWVTDGNSLQEVSLDIRPDLQSLSPVGANFAFHVSGKEHWLVCGFPTKMFIYDLDLSQWLPPWNITNKAVYSGEVSAGNYQLMVSTGTKAIALNQSGLVGSFNDNNVTYQPIIRTANHAVIPDFGKRFSYNSLGLYDQPSRTGAAWYIQGDTNSQLTFADIGVLIDDDPLNAGSIFKSIANFKTTPQVAWNRGQGSFLVQNVYAIPSNISGNGPVGRWYAIQFTLPKADQVDKIYAYFLAYEDRK